MTTNSVEQRFQRLEEIIEKQQLQIERLEAARICENMMSTYEYLHVNERHEEVMAMYAQKASDVRVYFGQMGYWEGTDAPQRAWGLLTRMPKEGSEGSMHFHPTLCPIVEVAGDGKTAKGVWTTVGFETGRDRETGKLNPQWAWGTYGVDFIKEDGEWKFWHFHIYRLVAHPFDKPWTEWDPASEGGMEVPDELKPDGPAVDDYPYNPRTITVIKPEPPKPYATWADTTMY